MLCDDSDPLTLSIDTGYNRLTCNAFGFVDDGLPSYAWQELVEDRVAFAEHPTTGEIAGFPVVEWASFDPAEHDALFTAEPASRSLSSAGLMPAWGRSAWPPGPG